jgi:hypothetical protein
MGLSYNGHRANRTSDLLLIPTYLLGMSNNKDLKTIQVAGVENGDPDFVRRRRGGDTQHT